MQNILISSKRITYSHAVSIYDSNDNILGFVLLEMENQYSESQVRMERQQVKYLIDKIVPILSYSDYIDTNLNIAESH